MDTSMALRLICTTTETYIHRMISVHEIANAVDMGKAFEIRRKVFVIEQNVDPAEEYDEYEATSVHFLASYNGTPCGTARIRETSKGYKLERFAVLKDFRGKGVGAALVKACLAHECLQPNGLYIYMHAQEHAVPFYSKLGFVVSGDKFWECEIPHFTMHQPINS